MEKRRVRARFRKQEKRVAQALDRPGKTKSVRRVGRSDGGTRMKTNGEALVDRLRKKAADADAGRTIDTTGLTDDQFIALLRR